MLNNKEPFHKYTVTPSFQFSWSQLFDVQKYPPPSGVNAEIKKVYQEATASKLEEIPQRC